MEESLFSPSLEEGSGHLHMSSDSLSQTHAGHHLSLARFKMGLHAVSYVVLFPCFSQLLFPNGRYPNDHRYLLLSGPEKFTFI